jgi:hypothetical protein
VSHPATPAAEAQMIAAANTAVRHRVAGRIDYALATFAAIC